MLIIFRAGCSSCRTQWGRCWCLQEGPSFCSTLSVLMAQLLCVSGCSSCTVFLKCWITATVSCRTQMTAFWCCLLSQQLGFADSASCPFASHGAERITLSTRWVFSRTSVGAHRGCPSQSVQFQGGACGCFGYTDARSRAPPRPASTKALAGLFVHQITPSQFCH